MEKLLISIFTLTSLIVVSNSLPASPHINPCKADDTLDKCAIRNGNEGWKKVVKGARKYRVPVLDPMEITELATDLVFNKQILIKLNFTDIKIIGLAHMELIDSKMDLKNKHIEWTAKVPKIDFIGNYNIKGNFLSSPIQETGPANISVEDMKMKAIIDYDLQKRKGEDYVKLGKIEMNYKFDKFLYTRLGNLFNGNKELSDNFHIVMNENWEVFNKQVSPRVSKTMVILFKMIVSNVLDMVPYNKMIIF